jgi:hypothetical protein
MEALEVFQKIEQLAKDWLAFSLEAHGWETRDYSDNVRCYFASNSDHKAVRLGRYGCQVEIAFFSPVQFSGITTSFLKNWEKVCEQCARELEVEREAIAIKSKKEIEDEKAAKVDLLKRQLAALEGEMQAAEVAA